IEGNVQRSELSNEATELSMALDRFRDRWALIGDDDPVRALVVHASIDSLIQAADDPRQPDRDESHESTRFRNLISFSRFAADIERARAALVTAIYAYDRFRDGLSRIRDLRQSFDDAVMTLIEDVGDATSGISASESVSDFIEVDVQDSPVRYPLEYLHDDIAHSPPVSEFLGRGNSSREIVVLHRELSRIGAFKSLQKRVESGETFKVKGANDISELRGRSLNAIQNALQESAHPHLSRIVLHNLVELIQMADAELDEDANQNQVSVNQLRRAIGDYIYATAVAKATPDASASVASALKE
ncbi:MAG: hypothetical protein ABEI52_07370, partial [Halobacteriaceae archaeon]